MRSSYGLPRGIYIMRESKSRESEFLVMNSLTCMLMMGKPILPLACVQLQLQPLLFCWCSGSSAWCMHVGFFSSSMRKCQLQVRVLANTLCFFSCFFSGRDAPRAIALQESTANSSWELHMWGREVWKGLRELLSPCYDRVAHKLQGHTVIRLERV